MEKEGQNTRSGRRLLKWLRGIGIGILGLWVLVMVVLQVALNSRVLTRTVNRLAADYVDGNVRFGRISASMFKSFPYLDVALDEFAITYPHDRYARYDRCDLDHFLLREGRGEKADTLMSLRRLELSLNWVSALSGRFRIRNARLDRPRVFVHYYDSTAANYDLFRFSASEEPEDSSSTPLPPLSLHKAGLTGQPHIVFTDQQDTLFGVIHLQRMVFEGRLANRRSHHNRVDLTLDSLFVAGRLPADTIAVGLDHFTCRQHREHVDVDAQAKAWLRSGSIGRLAVPASLSAQLRFPQRRGARFAAALDRMDLSVATVDLEGEGEIALFPDSTEVRLEAGIRRARIQELMDFFSDAFPMLKEFSTDARMDLTVLCDGAFNPARNTIPEIAAQVVVPRANLSWSGFKQPGSLELDLNATNDAGNRLCATLDKFCFRLGEMDLDLDGNGEDLLGDDPLFRLKAAFTGTLEDAFAFMPQGIGYRGDGRIDAGLKGTMRLSQMDATHFAEADLDGFVRSEGLHIQGDSLAAEIGKTEVTLSAMGNRFDKDVRKGTRMLGLKAKIDTADIALGVATTIKAGGLTLLAQNSAEVLKNSAALHPFMGFLGIRNLRFRDADEMVVALRGSKTRFKITTPREGDLVIPRLSLNSDNERLFLRQDVTRAGLRNVGFEASAKLNTLERRQRRRHFLDSLQRVYPGVPRDSLFARMRRLHAYRASLEAKDDFKDQDIDIRLDESLAKYIKEWNMNGRITAARGFVATPYFPLRTRLSDIRGSFSNDRVDLEHFGIKAGQSNLSAQGSLTGLRGALLGRRRNKIQLDFQVHAGKLDANELLGAYDAGSRYVPQKKDSLLNQQVSDEQYIDRIAQDSLALADSSRSPLIVIPANFVGNIRLQADTIRYSDLHIDWASADILVRDRCIQLTNTLATSNMGDIYFEGFYATRSKEDLKAGFDLTLADISAHQVIQLFPAVDTIMPMLKAFKGKLDCSMSATTDLDTNMNFVTRSINGVMNISGKDLELALKQDGDLKSLARLLMFKDKKKGKIDDMSVQGLISNNVLQVFPFILSIDRYKLALSGIQRFDQSFKYHVSVLKSPIPFRFGINLKGNFDKWKFRIGKAKYKNEKVPVFKTQLDTLQRNLVASIHNIFDRGVEAAVQSNLKARQAVEAEMNARNYSPTAPDDTLSAADSVKLDAMLKEYDAQGDSTAAKAAMADTEQDSKLQQLLERAADRRDAVETRKEARERKRQERAARREEKKAARKAKNG